MKNQECCN